MAALAQSIHAFAIRPAVVEDLPRMAECARQFYASSKFLKRFELERFCSAWQGFIESGAGVIIGLFDEDGTVRGAIGGLAFPDLYSGDLQATEFFWFVMEGSRGHGMKLLREFEKWAHLKGCTCLRMAHLSDSMPAKLEHVYGRLGYVLAEKQYVKELS